jgi:hypothetical protein
MACRCEIVKLARVVQAMAASLRLLQALKSLFLDHRRLFHNVEKRLAAEEGGKDHHRIEGDCGDPLLTAQLISQ